MSEQPSLVSRMLDGIADVIFGTPIVALRRYIAKREAQRELAVHARQRGGMTTSTITGR